MADQQVPQWCKDSAVEITNAVEGYAKLAHADLPPICREAIAEAIAKHAQPAMPAPGEPWNGHTELPWRFELSPVGSLIIWHGRDAVAYAYTTDVPRADADLNAQFILHACNTYYQREAEIAKLNKLLCDLTPGGSEFVNDPERCAEFVRRSQESTHRVLVQFKKERDAARLALTGCVEALEAAKKNRLRHDVSNASECSGCNAINTIEAALATAREVLK